MEKKITKILIVAGEASGDHHSADLLKSLTEKFEKTECRGIGGDCLEKAGMKQLYHVREMGVIGFFEVIKNLSFYKKVFNHILSMTDEWKPDFAILVDYPGFNIRLARELKKRKIPIIWYISPQVWAWKKKRAVELSELVDLMIVIFPFEEELYLNHGGNAVFVGHPLKDSVHSLRTREDICRELKFDPGKKVLAVLPGSRNREVTANLPTILNTLPLVADSVSQIVISVAPTVDIEVIDEVVSKSPVSVVLSETNIYDVLDSADVAVVAAGTASLESALAGVPTIVVYKLNWLTYFLGKLLVKVEHVSMTNILLEKRVFPELIQNNFNKEKLASEINSLIMNDESREEILNDLKELRNKLGEGNAAENAAEKIFKLISDGR